MPAEDPQTEQLLNKLGEIPVVHDGWNAVFEYYSRVKDYNSVTKFTLGTAESSLKIAADLSTPVLTHYKPQIESVNSFAVNKLKEIEAKYPLMKQPTEEVKEACVEYVQPVVDKVKPYVTYVSGVVDNTQKMANQIKSTSVNLVSGARDLGTKTVSNTVNMSLESPPGRLVTRSIDYALVQTDSLIDRFIPEETNGAENDADEDDEGFNGQEQVEQMEEMEASPARLAKQLSNVSTKLRQRLHQRAQRDFHLAKTRTYAAITQLQEILDVRDFTKTNMIAAYDKAGDIWAQIKEEKEPEDINADNTTYAQALEKRIVMMGRIIARQIDTGVSSLEKAATEAGLFLKDPISKSTEYKDLVYQFGSENISLTLERASEKLSAFQKRLREMIDSLESSQWIGLEIDMEGIDLAEEDDDDNLSLDQVPLGNHV